MAKDEKNKKVKEKKIKKSFLKESKAELKKVNWPTSKQLANDTATVIGIVLAVAIIVFILDFIFLELNRNVIIKGEEKIKNVNTTSIMQNIENVQNNVAANEITNVTTQESNAVVDNSTIQNNTVQ
ncbi:MAG: preprotein translocase subunit SecE [Firmicutes bacterium ADurb.Bin419]|nr:MAG: preprotein translocase subunit SecE [Firmicutes bacterium ADurb.Bin419]